MNQLFITRNILMTKGVQTLTTDYADKGDNISPTLSIIDVTNCLQKHFANMGEECWTDKKLNKEAIENKDGRVVSTFTINNIKLYYITDGLHLADDEEWGKDYPCTTILLPEEY